MHTISLKPGLATKVQRSLQALALTLGGEYRRWLRARQADATARALGRLDDHLLHDLGLDRSELLSTAAELHGRCKPERRHARPATALPH